MKLFYLLTLSSFCLNDPLCEPPYLKYKEINDSDLIQVHLISRHGARVSLHKPKNIPSNWTCHNKNIHAYNKNKSNLLNVHVSSGKSIFVGNCFAGQLVDSGNQGLTRLGKYIRSIYIEKLKFLPRRFKQSVLLFRTTSTHRTINSQMSFIEGLYPDHPDVIMNIADSTFDNWRNPASICPRLAKILAITKSNVNFTKEDIEVMEKASKLLGSTWRFNLDATVPAFCERNKLPRMIDRDYILKIQRIKAKETQVASSNESLFPLLFGYSMAEILNHMLNRISGNSSLRFIHWSAHDGNLNSALGYLGYIDEVWPTFGSYMLIELWKNHLSNSFYIVFRFNGKIIASKRFGNKYYVPFDEYYKFVKSHIPDLYKDCKFKFNKFIKNTFYS